MGSVTFTSTGWHSFNVPTKVKLIEVDLQGAGSAGGGGREGGRIHGVLAVTDNQVLQCFVGGHGTASSGSAGGDGGVGGGGDGANGRSRNGGDGGGGATYIRINTRDGTIKAVAGGAGGNSGDGGDGGEGGADVGGPGHAGTAGPGAIGNATGGTQTQGGNGGTSSRGAQYNGHDAENARVGQAGKGGIASSGECHGGGGGGGGYHGGGGGQASAPGFTAGGGGAGGSNYDGGLKNGAINTQGGGNTGDGQITLQWVDPSPANQPPNIPTDVKLAGQPATDGMHTRITGAPHVSALMDDPDNDHIRLIMHYSTHKNFGTFTTVTSDPVAHDTRATVQMGNLAQNTHYYVRLYARDEHGLMSVNLTEPGPGFTSFDFWTNEAAPPTTLRVNGGGSGTTITTIVSVTMSWKFNDPDEDDLQSGFRLRYRLAADSTSPAGPWTLIDKPNTADNTSPGGGPPAHSLNQWVFDPGTFKGNLTYEWQVRTKDLQNLWSPWSSISNFSTTSTTTPPQPTSPINDAAANITDGVTFTWRFRDPDVGDTQDHADIQYRVVGSSDWFTVLGSIIEPGSDQTWTLSGENFIGGQHYEWQVRTYDSAAHQSDWCDAETFWAASIGNLSEFPIPDDFTNQDTLGCGTYRAFVYQQGGQVLVGEITPIASLTFSRLRDDISGAQVVANGLGEPDCCEFLSRLRCWMHELVIFRDEVRVWEGPITLLTFETDRVTINAQDVMVYAFRRVMRHGFNDAFRVVSRDDDGTVTESAGLLSVVLRAQIILANAFAPFDPNILPYLTTITGPTDANESMVVQDWHATAWEQVDAMAAQNGLDYTTVGRRIILFGTHQPIGRLPQMTDGDFSSPPIVSEFGMQLATYMAVTDNAGHAGSAVPDPATGFSVTGPTGHPELSNVTNPYGPIEMLTSSFSDSATTTDTHTDLDPDALAALESALTEEARSDIAGRWPTPLIVRVPDNSTLSPDCTFGFQQLVPGVWLPLASSGTCRTVVQWQKLDSVTVTYDSSGEQIAVVMSPAPNGGQDPDNTGTEDGQ